MKRLPLRVRVAVFLRSLLIQSGWNYRTMIGTGMAFAIDPVLRYLRPPTEGKEGSTEAIEERRRMHGSHFNAHPYLASAALGSLARMEVDGAPAETVARFRSAVRGPLGGLGDRLVWATWLPLCALAGLGVLWAGASPVAAVVLFLGVYNVGHLALRIRGFQVGWEAGPALGSRLKAARIPELAARLERLLPVALGLVVGVAAAGGAGLGLPPAGAVGAVAAGVGIGAALEARAWKPAAGTAVVVTVVTLFWMWTRQA